VNGLLEVVVRLRQRGERFVDLVCRDDAKLVLQGGVGIDAVGDGSGSSVRRTAIFVTLA